MSRHIEDIERDIKATKEVISEKQGDIVRFKKEFCEAMSVKFTEETGINVGYKFKNTTRSYFSGRVTEVVREGYFTGMSVRYEHICFNYADIKKNGSMSQNTHYEYFYDDEIKKYSLC